MARAFNLKKVVNKRGEPLLGIKCEGINATTDAVAETQYTDTNGEAAFTALPDAGTVVHIKIYKAPFTVEWRNDIFLEASPISADHGGLTGLADDDHTQYTANADTNVSACGWVLDQDDMLGNDATKVPTQQSVKAYVDAEAGGGVALTVAANDTVAALKSGADYVCDGTNDHVEIQAALDALPATGGEVRLLDGTYNCQVAITLDSNQTLRGCGINTILTTATASLVFLSAVGGSGTEKTGITISDLQIDGATVSSVGISFSYVDYSVVYNTYIRRNNAGYHDGIRMVNSDFNRIVNNTLQDNDYEGLDVNTSNNNTLSQNIIQNCFKGIYLDGGNNTISLNVIEGSDDTGIDIRGNDENPANNTISGNVLQNNYYGIYVDADNNNVSNNTVQSSTDIGIEIDGKHNNVSNNVVRTSGGEGIYINGGNNNNVVGNICTANSQDTTNTDDDICLNNDANYNNVQGNTCRAGTLTKKPRYGINIANANCDGNLVINNDLYDDGFGTGAFNDGGTATRYNLDDTAGGTNAEVKLAPTSNAFYDHCVKDATAAQQGHATAAQITKLDGIEAGAQVNDAETDPVFIASEAAGLAVGDAAKLAGIEAAADVTDAANVAAAGALMVVDIDDAPVDGETTAPISSNWAFDHNAAATGVHGVGTGTIASVSTADKIIYVWGEAVGDDDGTSKANGFTTIQAAVDSMEDIILHAYTIKVCNGTKKTGAADGDVANHLQDDTSSQFVAGDVGKGVFNVTDGTWGVITAYNDAGDVTLAADTFPDGNEDYVIEATPYRETVYLNSNPTVNPAHAILGSLVIEAEYYWYGDCEANAVAGKIVDTGLLANVEIGDRVFIEDFNGANGRAQDYEIGTVDDIAGLPDNVGTTLTKTPTTGWRYTIAKSEISGSDNGTDAGTARNACFSATSINNVRINGLRVTFSDGYCLNISSCRNWRLYGCIFENCDGGLLASVTSLLYTYYCYIGVGSTGTIVSSSGSYADSRYGVMNGTGNGFYVYRFAGGLVSYSYIDDFSAAIVSEEMSWAYISRSTVENSVTKGLYATYNSAIETAYLTNNAITPVDPVGTTEGAYIA